MTNEPPFLRSYWAIPGKLLAGCYPGDPDPDQMRLKLEALVRAGVTRVINLMEESEVNRSGKSFAPYAEQLVALGLKAGRQIHCDRFPIRDVSVPTSAVMSQIVRSIRQEIESGGTVYVHCWGGKGRTGVVIGCYLVESGAEAHVALKQLYELTEHAREYFRQTPETTEQSEFVRIWRRQTENSASETIRDRFLGAFVGLAVGDAVGTTLEFKSPGSFDPITNMVGGGPFKLKPGEWTDDTSMALCLAASLLENNDFDPRDQMERYVRWWKAGYMSVKPSCFDIGTTVAAALRRFLDTGNPYAGSTDPETAGNGSIMRLAPVPLFYAADAATAIERAGESSKMTHGTLAAVDACRYMAGLIVGAVKGATKDQLLSALYSPVSGLWDREPLHPEIETIAAGSFKTKQPPELRGTGYVVASFEAALWAFHFTENFRDGCLRAANPGDDADTTAAVYGQIAGAFYGLSGIPREWRERIAKGDLISDLGERLYMASGLLSGAG